MFAEEKEYQYGVMDSTEITNEEKISRLSKRFNAVWLYYKVFKFFENLKNGFSLSIKDK